LLTATKLLTAKLHSRCVGVGNFEKVTVEKFWKVGVGARHFTYDSATLSVTPLIPWKHGYTTEQQKQN